jgi:GMP synthase-like glutamine amidotransferase
MKRVLAIQHYWDDPPGYLGEIMEEHGIPYDVVQVEEAPIPDPANYAAVVTLGGPQSANAHDKHPYMVQEKEFLRHLVEQDIPYLGMCLGGQLLASALHATVTRHHTYEIGFYEVQLTSEGQTDPLFQGLPGYQQVIHWHEEIFDMPGGAVKLASSENTPNQAFRIGRRAYGLQYHIEVSPAMLDIWFGYPDYKKLIREVLGPDGPDKIASDRSTHYPIYKQHTRTLFENFLRISECL